MILLTYVVWFDSPLIRAHTGQSRGPPSGVFRSHCAGYSSSLLPIDVWNCFASFILLNVWCDLIRGLFSRSLQEVLSTYNVQITEQPCWIPSISNDTFVQKTFWQSLRWQARETWSERSPEIKVEHSTNTTGGRIKCEDMWGYFSCQVEQLLWFSLVQMLMCFDVFF